MFGDRYANIFARFFADADIEFEVEGRDEELREVVIFRLDDGLAIGFLDFPLEGFAFYSDSIVANSTGGDAIASIFCYIFTLMDVGVCKFDIILGV